MSGAACDVSPSLSTSSARRDNSPSQDQSADRSAGGALAGSPWPMRGLRGQSRRVRDARRLAGSSDGSREFALEEFKATAEKSDVLERDGSGEVGAEEAAGLVPRGNLVEVLKGSIDLAGEGEGGDGKPPEAHRGERWDPMVAHYIECFSVGRFGADCVPGR